MRQVSSAHGNDQQSIAQKLIENHGPIICGATLSKVMGFPTTKAFNQSRRRGSLGIKTFRIEGRRGVFALTSDLAQWIEQLATQSAL